MRNQLIITIAVALISIGATCAFFCFRSPQAANAVTSPPTRSTATVGLIAEPIQPIPYPTNLDPGKIELGRRLFNDVRLSANNTVSCSTCHHLTKGGADGLVLPVGINGAEGDINTPTVFNCVLNFRQFWDGRASSLEEQIDGPTHHPKEMASNWQQIVTKLSADRTYVDSFGDLYKEGISGENIKDAIACFERSLLTPDSRFDKFLRGDAAAITERERKGYELFKQFGCTSCHQGMNAGGNMFQPFGVMGNYFADRGNVTKADLGRFNVTGEEQDRHRFRVPSLRNVSLTAPYFHDGSAATLDEAVRTMAKYQLGQPIADEEVALIVEFLHTLTGARSPGDS
jgi:cytochrome c peroxidase